MTTAKLTDDGRLLCPDCDGEVELRYCQTFHRRDAFVARFDPKTDRLYMIGKPEDNLSDTLQMYDEFLLCPECKRQYDVPWPEDSDQEQYNVGYPGDFLRALKPDIPVHECPQCGGTHRIKYVENYEISRRAREYTDDFEYVDDDENDDSTTDEGEWLLVEGDDKIEYEGGGEGEYLQCYECFCRWSIPSGGNVEYN